MSERLDELFRRSSLEAIDRDLGGLEASVGHEIAKLAVQRRTATAMAPVGVASIVMAATIGLAAGGATAIATPQRADGVAFAFVMADNLAPSTLLDE